MRGYLHSPRSQRRVVAAALAVLTTAVAARITYVLVVLDDVPLGLDATWYVLQGAFVRDGYGYVSPASVFTGEPVPTAGFPPLYPAWQAVWQTVVGDGPTTVRLAGVVPGAATVALTMALGRRLLGPARGVAAGAVVAADLAMIGVDGSTMSESLAVPLTASILLVGHRMASDGLGGRRVFALGALGGLAILTRQDLLFVTAAVAVLAVAAARRRFGDVLRLRRVIATLCGVAVVAACIVGPWAWRNHQTLGAFAVSTTSPSSALAGSNCEATYRGASIGSWEYPCVVAATPADADETTIAASQQHAAWEHVRADPGRLPVVLAARQLRVWSLWDPSDLADRDADETRHRGFQVWVRAIEGVAVLLGFAGVGLLVRRSGWQAAVAIAPLVAVSVSAAVSYGNPRFNAIAHPALAIGIVHLTALGVERVRGGPYESRTGGLPGMVSPRRSNGAGSP